MKAAAIDANLDRIRSDLHYRGISYDPLMEDMLDHICCMVEDKMEEGRDFASSYDTVMSSIEEKALPRIQHQTLLNLDKTYQRMKNLTYIFGLSSAIMTIIGAFFKKMHWPGAGILITLGIVMVVLVFLPMYFITMQKEQEEKKNPIYGIVGYFTIALLLAGALFKIMHWPGAGFMMELGAGFLIIAFIPLYVVNAFQRSGSKKVALPYVVMILVGISIILVYSNVRMGKYLIDVYEREAIVIDGQLEKTHENSALLIAGIPDSLDSDKKEKVMQIHNDAAALLDLVHTMQEGMKAYLNQPGVSLEDIQGKDNKNAGREAILDNGAGSDFIARSKNFQESLHSLLDNPVVLYQVDDHLEFTGDVWYHTYGPDQILERPFVNTYYILSDWARGIALAEYVAISHLLQ